MIEHTVVWKCDALGCRNSVSLAAKPENIYSLPEGWYFLQATRDNRRVYVKTVCREHFTIVTDLVGIWGLNDSTKPDPDRHIENDE